MVCFLLLSILEVIRNIIMFWERKYAKCIFLLAFVWKFAILSVFYFLTPYNMNNITQAAQCAKAIRKDLKIAFPNIKFSVRSSNFAGGNAVDISYDNWVPTEQIQSIVSKYKYGTFDWMTDCYNYDNRDDSIPQSKYVMVHRNITNDIRQTEKEQLANSYGIKNINDEQEWYKIFHEWSDMVVYRHLSPKTFA